MALQAHQPEPSVDIPLQSTSDPRTRYSTDPGRENDHDGDYGVYLENSNEMNASSAHLAAHTEYSTPPQAHHFQPHSYQATSTASPGTILPTHMREEPSSTGSYSGSIGPDGKKKRPKSSRMPSFDLLANKEWEEFDVRKGDGKRLQFAEGDVGTTKVSRAYYFLITRSIITRWILYIVPILALLWIPGVIWFTASESLHENLYVWSVGLLWWSVWLSVWWCSWWASSALYMMLPAFLRATVAVIIGGDRSWTEMIRALHKYLVFSTWTLVSFIAFQPLILHRKVDENSNNTLATVSNVLFGFFLCSLVVGGEKLVIQFIAYNFHQQTYQDRMDLQAFQIKTLVVLYQNSSDMGRSDTLRNGDASTRSKGAAFPKMAVKKALKGLRDAAATTTTALGNVASEMAGSSVLQPNSPQSMVTAALTSANKTRALARRIYYSFRVGKSEVELADIARLFPNLETAQEAFGVLDSDGNGGATRDEIEMALMDIHRERLSLASSMRDLDGAVRRLDSILMSVVLLACILIETAMITTKLTALVTSAGTFLLGLSWLIGSTAQEVLGACIFLFVKHPFDVGDRVDIDANSYVVLEMNLMSTVFRRTDGKWVFLSNNILNTKLIENVRRSGPTSETFKFGVSFDTSFDHIQALREKMLLFVKAESRDYMPSFDISISDFPTQSSLDLTADIKYKSNWQQGALKVQRRNKWICAMKDALQELKIFGPGGDPNPPPEPVEPIQYTKVPYVPKPTTPLGSGSDHHSDTQTAVDSSFTLSHNQNTPQETLDLRRSSTRAARAPEYSFLDQRNVINDPSGDIFNVESSDASTMGYATGPNTRANTPSGGTPVRRGQGGRRQGSARDVDGGEVIEMEQSTSKPRY